MIARGSNIFTALLSLLNVRYTDEFAARIFNEHPHKYNLLGLSRTLNTYGVENAATRITDKERDLPEITLPFVAHFGGEFVIIYKVSGENVGFWRNGRTTTIPLTDFIKAWSGVVLLAEANDRSGEPDYRAHRRQELLKTAEKCLMALAALAIIAIAVAANLGKLGILHGSLFLLSLAGLYVSYLLVQKQLHIGSRTADKICSLFGKHDCNDVLETPAAKLFGLIGWSEVGLGYFATGLLTLIFQPAWTTGLAMLNLIALPYTVWSVWYQWRKARQWCALCLIVQALLWADFAINVAAGWLPLSFLQLQTAAIPCIGVFALFALTTFAFNLLLARLAEARMVSHLKQEIASIKTHEKVFDVLLKEQPRFETRRTDSCIMFGRADAPLHITILSNPYCNPCAAMHKRIEQFLRAMDGKACVQYVLSSFDESFDNINRYLIAYSLHHPDPMPVFSDWFERGKPLGEKFFQDMNLDIADPAVEAEFRRHAEWRERTKLRATPTVIVEGFQLPENYRIEDLQNIIEFSFESK
jgi:uncharacterized membrane protein